MWFFWRKYFLNFSLKMSYRIVKGTWNNRKKRLNVLNFTQPRQLTSRYAALPVFIAQAPTLSTPGLNLSHNAALFICYHKWILSIIGSLLCAPFSLKQVLKLFVQTKLQGKTEIVCSFEKDACSDCAVYLFLQTLKILYILWKFTGNHGFMSFWSLRKKIQKFEDFKRF